MSFTDTDMDREIFLGFIDESMESLAEAETAMIALEANPQNTDVMASIFRAAHSLKGNSAFFGLMNVKKLAHRMEDLLDAVRQQRIQSSRQVIDALLPGLDLLRKMLENVRDGLTELTGLEVIDTVLQGLDHALEDRTVTPVLSLDSVGQSILNARSRLPDDLKNLLDDALLLTNVAEGDVGEKETDQKPQIQASVEPEAKKSLSPDRSAATRNAADKRKTLRIAESSLDVFLDHVGELIGIEEMLRYCLRQAGSKAGDMSIYRELKQVVEQFCKVSANLRSGIMDARKVQAKALLDKAPRLVRDVAANTGKQIRVNIVGSDMSIDKNYAELLDSPLVHMVRNAADHGIGPPEERVQAGKAAEGEILIELTEKENDIRLIITDDGRGLNHDALTRKAVDMGLVKAGQPLSEDDIIRLLFTSGVSTAAEITDISGRGVGMDVVRQAIDDAGGRITVDSTHGQGSVFTIMLPKNVSTKIIDGYLVRGKDNSVFVLPLNSVLEAFVAGQADIFTVKQQGYMIKRRETLHPVINIDNAIQDRGEASCTQTDTPLDEVTLVLMEISGKSIALAVTEIVGVQKVVVKAIEGLKSQNDIIEGAAVMGDGCVALILGEQGLGRLLTESNR